MYLKLVIRSQLSKGDDLLNKGIFPRDRQSESHWEGSRGTEFSMITISRLRRSDPRGTP